MVAYLTKGITKGIENMRLDKRTKQNYIDFALHFFNEQDKTVIQNFIDNEFKKFTENGKKDFCTWMSLCFVLKAVRMTALKLYHGETDGFYKFMDLYTGANMTNLARDVMIELEKKGFNCYLEKRYK